MKRFSITILIVIFSASSYFVYAQHHCKANIDSVKQHEWIKQTASTMYNLKPGDFPKIEPGIQESGDFYMISYKLKSQGSIRLSSGAYIFLMSNSSHENPVVGYITVAIDNKNNIFVNYGHVCGGIINFECNKKILLKSSTDFFDNFTDDTGGTKWVQFNMEVSDPYFE